MDFNKVKTAWKALANNKKNETHHHLEYCILKAMYASTITGQPAKDLAVVFTRKAFRPITNKNKLEINQYHPYRAVYLGRMRHEFTSMVYTPKLLNLDINDLLTPEEYEVFRAIWKELTHYNLKAVTREYSMIFVRTDIPEIQYVVQAAHIAYVQGSKFPDAEATKRYFTIKGVDADEFKQVKEELTKDGIQFETFFEPDLGKHTAVMTRPVTWEEKLRYHKYGLLTIRKENNEKSIQNMGTSNGSYISNCWKRLRAGIMGKSVQQSA